MLRFRAIKQSSLYWSHDPSTLNLPQNRDMDNCSNLRGINLHQNHLEKRQRSFWKKSLQMIAAAVFASIFIAFIFLLYFGIPYSSLFSQVLSQSRITNSQRSPSPYATKDIKLGRSSAQTSSIKKKSPKSQTIVGHTGDTRSSRWPPMITSIPEIRPDPELLSSGLSSSFIDEQFCRGSSPCQLLLPLWIGEQESRSRLHLLQVLQFASALNRTLVLPNVGKSRIGACGRWEFEVYYDIGSFVGKGSSQPIKKVMLMDDFKTWLEMRPTNPTAQLLFVDETMVDEDAFLDDATATVIPGEGLDVYIDKEILDLQDPRLRRTRCLSSKYRQLNFDVFTPVSLHLATDIQKAFVPGDAIVDTFSQNIVEEAAFQGHDSDPLSPDVLVLYWDIRHFPFAHVPNQIVESGPPSSTSLLYSPNIRALSDRLATGPQLAIHWRMETVPPVVLPDCAEALVDTLNTLLSDPALAQDIKTVWLASDFPWPISSSDSYEGFLELATIEEQSAMKINRGERRSSTFKSMSKHHIEAIEVLKAAFRDGGVLEGYKLTGVSEELERVRQEGNGYVLEDDDDESALLKDIGILGILDKLAAVNAALFVRGSRGCGRVR
ncbi:hypothetical protein C8Q75DRAFT_763711 [Abortiporus biennis]|nr:hypothetical protein C8Q75DRAFT_763711 [Abortiporus biennis]